MQSYDDWKAQQIFLENIRTVPYVPSSERNPVGNGLAGITHRVGHDTEHSPFNSTAPSSNSGGMVRRQASWENMFNNRVQKMEPTAAKEIPRTTGLGHQGMSILSKTSFPEDPMNTKSDQLGDFEGQFEHYTWANYFNWRENMGMQQPQQPAQGMGMQQPQQPAQDPRMNPAAPQQPQADPNQEMVPSRVMKLIDMIDGIMQKKPPRANMAANQIMTKKLGDNVKGAMFNTSNVKQAQQLRRGAAMSKDELTRPSKSDEKISGPRKGSDWGRTRDGGPMTLQTMGKR